MGGADKPPSHEEQHPALTCRDGTKLRHDKNVTPGRAAGAAGPDQRGQYAHVRWTPARLRATWPGDPIPRVASHHARGLWPRLGRLAGSCTFHVTGTIFWKSHLLLEAARAAMFWP